MLTHLKLRHGDIEAGFATADELIARCLEERRYYRDPSIHQYQASSMRTKTILNPRIKRDDK